MSDSLEPCPEPGCTTEGHHFHADGGVKTIKDEGVRATCHLEPYCYTTPTHQRSDPMYRQDPRDVFLADRKLEATFADNPELKMRSTNTKRVLETKVDMLEELLAELGYAIEWNEVTVLAPLDGEFETVLLTMGWEQPE